jgi:PAT family beta-lactamase induction signal transducer AmpG
MAAGSGDLPCSDRSPAQFRGTALMYKESEKCWLAHLAEDQRYAAMAGLGFSSGLPFLLVYSTQSAWRSEAGVPIETIGLLSELTIAYKFKFVWSPFLDKYDPPLLASFVGRRRG